MTRLTTAWRGCAGMLSLLSVSAAFSEPMLPMGPPWLQVELASGSVLELRAASAALPPGEVLGHLLARDAGPPDLLALPGQLLLGHQDQGCHVLTRVQQGAEGGSEIGESRLCPGAAGNALDLGAQAQPWHRYRENGVTLAIWTVPLTAPASAQWLADTLRARGWQPLWTDATGGQWVRGTQRLEGFLTPLDGESGVLLVDRGGHD